MCVRLLSEVVYEGYPRVFNAGALASFTAPSFA